LCFEHGLIVAAQGHGVFSLPYRRVSFDVNAVALGEVRAWQA